MDELALVLINIQAELRINLNINYARFYVHALIFTREQLS